MSEVLEQLSDEEVKLLRQFVTDIEMLSLKLELQQSRYRIVQLELKSKYNLGGQDQVNTSTGIITRL